MEEKDTTFTDNRGCICYGTNTENVKCSNISGCISQCSIPRTATEENAMFPIPYQEVGFVLNSFLRHSARRSCLLKAQDAPRAHLTATHMFQVSPYAF